METYFCLNLVFGMAVNNRKINCLRRFLQKTGINRKSVYLDLNHFLCEQCILFYFSLYG